MSQFSLAHLTALWSVPAIGERTFQRCLLAQKKAELSDGDFWVKQSVIAKQAALSDKQVVALKNFHKEHSFTSFYEQLLSSGIQVLSIRDANYPALLTMTDFAPSILFVKSQSKISQQTWQDLLLAVVGTRRMTHYGRFVIKSLLRDIIESRQPPLKIVSGFMYGIDVTAMKLAHQLSQTVGILGYGFNYCFPRHHQALMTKMLAEGAIFLTEYPPATAPSAGSFVQRNRIIAGLAQATLVVEAAEKSGSLITAQFALDANRTVMAVPGPVFNPYSRGCQNLINDGAVLVSTVQDFWRALGQSAPNKQKNSQLLSSVGALTDNEAKIIHCLELFTNGANLAKLLAATQLKEEQLRQELFNLELKNLIILQGQNYILNP